MKRLAYILVRLPQLAVVCFGRLEVWCHQNLRACLNRCQVGICVFLSAKRLRYAGHKALAFALLPARSGDLPQLFLESFVAMLRRVLGVLNIVQRLRSGMQIVPHDGPR